MSRAKLSDLGIHLPLIPTTAVGSFPKPPTLAHARSRFTAGEISREELEEETRLATAYWIGAQERAGLDVLVDGEMSRGDMVAYFAENMTGYSPGGLVRSYGNRYYRKPIIVDEVHWTGPITLRWWKLAQSLTTRPVKAVLTGPYTMMDWSFDEHYPDRRSACMALAHELRREVDTLIAAGAKILQIDEPALSVRPEELSVAIEALHVLTDHVPAYLIAHTCYGAFESIYPGILDLPVDNLDLAISHSTLDLLTVFARHPLAKDMSVGVLDVHSHQLPPGFEVEHRIRRATQILDPASVWISPDCGLKTRTVSEAEAQLERLVAATQVVRGELTCQPDALMSPSPPTVARP